MKFSTADLCDKYRDEVQVLRTPLISYGGVKRFSGKIVTMKLNRNNFSLVEMLRDEEGSSRGCSCGCWERFFMQLLVIILNGLCFIRKWVGAGY